ncbi:MAG: hypothetical protein M3527_02005, partial [Actinomycetota bacterium]|nr:hypothetical protein [Actinomycetota bacterium]
PALPLTVSVDDHGRIPDLVFALTAAGVRVTRVEPFTPSLEDLYFAVRDGWAGDAVPVDETPLFEGKLSSGNRLGRRFGDPFSASPAGRR